LILLYSNENVYVVFGNLRNPDLTVLVGKLAMCRNYSRQNGLIKKGEVKSGYVNDPIWASAANDDRNLFWCLSVDGCLRHDGVCSIECTVLEEVGKFEVRW
jgi:hypothetical protein